MSSDYNIMVNVISGNFLTKNLPEDWYCWGEDEVEEFIDEHVIESLEQLDTSVIVSLIDSCARDAVNYM